MRKHLTYSNVMATGAMFLALGGVSYAAITLPANSVGSKQIKDGAVGSADVKNHALKAGDFKGGLPSGPRGQRGPKGDAGPAAAKYWAQIAGGATPSVGASSGGVTVSRTAANLASHVVFPADVGKCAATITIRGGLPGRTPRILSSSTGDTINIFTSFVDSGTTTTTTDAYDIAVFC
jgi:hypothetical protein